MIRIPHFIGTISEDHKSIFNLNNAVNSTFRILFNWPQFFYIFSLHLQIYQFSWHSAYQYSIFIDSILRIQVSVGGRRFSLNVSRIFLLWDLDHIVIFQEKQKRLLSIIFYEEWVIDFHVIDQGIHILHVLTWRGSDPGLFVWQLSSSDQKLIDHIARNQP